MIVVVVVCGQYILICSSQHPSKLHFWLHTQNVIKVFVDELSYNIKTYNFVMFFLLHHKKALSSNAALNYVLGKIGLFIKCNS